MKQHLWSYSTKPALGYDLFLNSYYFIGKDGRAYDNFVKNINNSEQYLKPFVINVKRTYITPTFSIKGDLFQSIVNKGDQHD